MGQYRSSKGLEEQSIEAKELEKQLQGKTFSLVSPEEFVELAKEIGSKLSESALKSTQLRRFYDAVKTIEIGLRDKKLGDCINDDTMAKLIFLKPVIHYAAIRINGLKSLEEVIVLCLKKDKIKTKKDFTYFVKFFEAIVAYHKS